MRARSALFDFHVHGHLADSLPEHRRKDREALAAIREQIATLKLRRREAMRNAVEICCAERFQAKERAKDLRKAVLE